MPIEVGREVWEKEREKGGRGREREAFKQIIKQRVRET